MSFLICIWGLENAIFLYVLSGNGNFFVSVGIENAMWGLEKATFCKRDLENAIFCM